MSYCHCSDCRRWTGAPVAAFAAFDRHALAAQPALGTPLEHVPGVQRWQCDTCGSPLAAWFDYLPEQIYVPVGLFDQIDMLVPKLHSHAENAPVWLHIQDGLPRQTGTARAILSDATK